MATTMPNSTTISGAEALLRTLLRDGVGVCFANPGTSEMHFVDALDGVEGMRCILGLFEGTVTGAADGYARMLDRPAATLLHLGPGLANGLSNLHNARRAQSPIVNVIGDHATYHRRYDAPLTSDIEAVARPVSHWVRTSPNASTVATDAASAVAAARSAPGRVASLILPADTAWNRTAADRPVPVGEASPPGRPDDDVIEAGHRLLTSHEPTAILLAGRATRERPLGYAGQIAAKTGAALFAQTHTPRISRGAGRVEVTRVPYPIDRAIATLAEYRNIILVGAKAPVAFFAYPNKPSLLHAPGATIHELARVDQDPDYALEALAYAVGAEHSIPARAPLTTYAVPPDGPLTPQTVGGVLAARLPEHAIVVDESISTGGTFLQDTRNCPPHDWLCSTGGSIGFGIPNAIGAAVACPDRKVIVLESDGSALYSPQSLWTIAHEHLDIVVLIFANHGYQILRGEMEKVGKGGAGPKAASLMDLTSPTIDWVQLAASLGIESSRAATVAQLDTALAAAHAHTGPVVIEVSL